jgi:hypothetical protein
MLTTRLTAPIAGLGFVAVRAFDQQAKAIAQVEAGLKSTGNQVGFTSKELQKMASDLQKSTLFGDEEILKGATSQLLTFTNITGQEFARTQQAALDLATRLDGDLKSASIQLGKALNDPIANLSALSRSGIQFSKDQKEVIKSLAESGRLAEAQGIILTELEKQYGGSARAAAKAGAGGFKQLSNSLGDLMEDFGKIITEALNPFIDKLKGITEAVIDLDDNTKKKILNFTLGIAAIGPALIGVSLAVKGLIATIGILKGVIVAFGTATLPVWAVVGLAVGVFAAVVTAGQNLVDNYERIKVHLGNALLSMGLAFQNLALVAVKSIKSIIEFVVGNANVAGLLSKLFGLDLGAEATEAMGLDTLVLGIEQSILQSEQALVDGYARLGQIEPVSLSDSARNAFVRLKGVFQAGLENILSNTGINDLWNDLKSKFEFNIDSPDEPKQSSTFNYGGFGSGAPVVQGQLKGTSKDLESQGKAVDGLKEKWQGLSEGLVNNMVPAISQGLGDIAGSFIEMTAQAFQSGKGFKGAFNMVLTSLADLAVRVGKIAIGVGLGIEGIRKALNSLNPAAAIAAGVALVALGSYAKSALSSAASGVDTASSNQVAQIQPQQQQYAMVSNVIKLNDSVLYKELNRAEVKRR